MGVYVHLAIDSERVPEATWQGIYEQARHVAKQWNPRPLGLGWRQIGAVRVAQYTPEIESEEGLHLVGDAESLMTAESSVFPARLDRHATLSATEDAPATTHDVLVAVVSDVALHDGAPRGYSSFLGGKTQGLPIHVLLVALGMVVENALPGIAMVYGDLSLADCEQAQSGASAILGQKLELPVVAEVSRMRGRLAAGLDAEAIDLAVRTLGTPDRHCGAILWDLLGILRSQAGARIRHELEHVAPSCRDLGSLAPDTRQLFHQLLDVVHTSIERGELRQRIGQWSATRTHEVIARATLERHVTLTSMAWDAIMVADVEELAFVLGVLCMDTTRLESHQAVRAMLENRALRQV